MTPDTDKFYLISYKFSMFSRSSPSKEWEPDIKGQETVLTNNIDWFFIHRRVVVQSLKLAKSEITVIYSVTEVSRSVYELGTYPVLIYDAEGNEEAIA